MKVTIRVGLLASVAAAMATAAIAAPDNNADFVEYSGYESHGPSSLMAGVSGTFTFRVANYGFTAAPLELYIIFTGAIDQTGQIVAPGMDCDVREDDGINAAVRCTMPVLEPSGKVELVVQGRGQSAGAGKIGLVMNPARTATEADYDNNNFTFEVVVQ